MALRRWDRPAKLGVVAVAVAAGLLALSLWRALRASETTDEAPASRPADATPAVALQAPADASPLREAIALDPFRPDRSRAAARYVPLEDRRPTAPPPHTRQRDPMATLRLVGTAAEGGAGAIAIIAGLGRTPRVLRVGDVALAGWRLARVEGSAAILEHPDSTVVVRVSRSGVTRSRP